MTTQHASTAGGRTRQVGKVVTTVRVTNRGDEVRASDGAIPRADIRTLVLPDVLVDTGAKTLCLPSDLVAELGLPLMKTVEAVTASGVERMSLHRDALLAVEGREATVECLALPAGSPPLLGVISIEAMGLEPDLKGKRLRLLPETGRETHFTA